MSQENVEIVRAGFEAWNRGDMDAVRQTYHPDVIVRMVEGWPEPGPYFGREAVMREFTQMRETWKGDTVEPVGDFIHVGDRVALRVLWRGQGQGPQADVEVTVLQTVRQGRVFAIEYFWDHTEVLQAMGLSEQDARTDSS